MQNLNVFGIIDCILIILLLYQRGKMKHSQSQPDFTQLDYRRNIDMRDDESSLFTSVGSNVIQEFTQGYHTSIGNKNLINNARFSLLNHIERPKNANGDEISSGSVSLRSIDESSIFNRRPSFPPKFLPQWVLNHQDFRNSYKWMVKQDVIESILIRPPEERSTQQHEALCQFLQQTTFFENFHYNCISALAKFLELKYLSPNEIIYREEDTATHVYLLRSGKIEIQTFVETNRNLTPKMMNEKYGVFDKYTSHYNSVIQNTPESKQPQGTNSAELPSYRSMMRAKNNQRVRRSFWQAKDDQYRIKNAQLAMSLQISSNRFKHQQNSSTSESSEKTDMDSRHGSKRIPPIIREDLVYEPDLGVKRRLFKSVETRNECFGIDELPSDIIQWCLKYSNKINVKRLWTCKSAEHSKVACLKIDDIVNTLHLTQFEKSNQLISWMQSFDVFNNLPNKADFDRILSFLFVKSARKGKMLVKQDKSPTQWIFILNGELKIIKTLKNAFTNSDYNFVIDTINEKRNPCIGMEMVINNMNNQLSYSQYSCKVASTNFEYMVIPENKSHFLLNLQPFRQWCLKRCFELQCLLYEKTQTFYRQHSVDASIVGFPRSLSYHTLIHPTNDTIIGNHTVWSLSPLKKSKYSKSYQHKTGREMIRQIYHKIQRQNNENENKLNRRHSKKFI